MYICLFFEEKYSKGYFREIYKKKFFINNMKEKEKDRNK